MVGRFGEVYVMDWGLAKMHEQPPPRIDGNAFQRAVEERLRENIQRREAQLRQANRHPAWVEFRPVGIEDFGRGLERGIDGE